MLSDDELRALANALEPMAKAPCFDGININRAADYLLACADGKPVAWMYEYDGCVDHPVLSARQWPSYSEPWTETPLYAAPAAPQAEPCIGNDPICPCQDGDACHYKDAADGTKAWPVPQAEPKREPLSDDAISYEHACRSSYESACAASDFDSFKLGVRFAERAHRIGGSDE